MISYIRKEKLDLKLVKYWKKIIFSESTKRRRLVLRENERGKRTSRLLAALNRHRVRPSTTPLFLVLSPLLVGDEEIGDLLRKLASNSPCLERWGDLVNSIRSAFVGCRLVWSKTFETVIVRRILVLFPLFIGSVRRKCTCAATALGICNCRVSLRGRGRWAKGGPPNPWISSFGPSRYLLINLNVFNCNCGILSWERKKNMDFVNWLLVSSRLA